MAKGRAIYLSIKEIRMINNAIDSKIEKLQEIYEQDGGECELSWMDEYRRLRNKKFYEHWGIQYD